MNIDDHIKNVERGRADLIDTWILEQICKDYRRIEKAYNRLIIENQRLRFKQKND